MLPWTPLGVLSNIWLMHCCYLSNTKNALATSGPRGFRERMKVLWANHQPTCGPVTRKPVFSWKQEEMTYKHKQWWSWREGPEFFRGPVLRPSPWDLRHPASLQRLLFFIRQLQSAWLNWSQGVPNHRTLQTLEGSDPEWVLPCPGGAGNAPPCPDTALAKPSDTSVGMWPAGLGRKD